METRNHTKKVWMPCGNIPQKICRILRERLRERFVQNIFVFPGLFHQGVWKCPTTPIPEAVKQLQQLGTIFWKIYNHERDRARRKDHASHKCNAYSLPCAALTEDLRWWPCRQWSVSVFPSERFENIWLCFVWLIINKQTIDLSGVAGLVLPTCWQTWWDHFAGLWLRPVLSFRLAIPLWVSWHSGQFQLWKRRIIL